LNTQAPSTGVQRTPTIIAGSAALPLFLVEQFFVNKYKDTILQWVKRFRIYCVWNGRLKNRNAAWISSKLHCREKLISAVYDSQKRSM